MTVKSTNADHLARSCRHRFKNWLAVAPYWRDGLAYREDIAVSRTRTGATRRKQDFLLSVAEIFDECEATLSDVVSAFYVAGLFKRGDIPELEIKAAEALNAKLDSLDTAESKLERLTSRLRLFGLTECADAIHSYSTGACKFRNALFEKLSKGASFDVLELENAWFADTALVRDRLAAAYPQ